MTYPLLASAPMDHASDEFLTYLRKNNIVKYEDKHWLVIRNCKYFKFDREWYTAFLKGGVANVSPLLKHFGSMEWKKKPIKTQSVRRFHIHLFEPEKV